VTVGAVRAIEELVERFALPRAALEPFGTLLHLLATDPAAPTSIREPDGVVAVHFADALMALELEPVRSAASVADLGSGAGIPGLPLAIARPAAAVALIESSQRRCAFLERAVAACGLSNVSVVNVRAEAWHEGFERFELVTVRALAPLPVVVEYASPLLVVGGRLVVWRGKRDPAGEAAAVAAAEQLAMVALEPKPVRPYHGSRSRHLQVFVKEGTTPAGFPRRPGIALKRPLGRHSQSR
jgi:16S rRNA (guanine527-N7)-methyltransferase